MPERWSKSGAIMRYPSPRKTLHYPRGSKIDEFLEKKSKENPNLSMWMHIEKIIENLPKSEKEESIQDYHDYVKKVMAKHPGEDVEDMLYSVWTLIYRRILKIKDTDEQDVTLPDSYFEKLKKF